MRALVLYVQAKSKWLLHFDIQLVALSIHKWTLVDLYSVQNVGLFISSQAQEKLNPWMMHTKYVLL